MYRCLDCGFEFETAAVCEERHGLDSPPYEKIYLCPYCDGRRFSEIEVRYCRCCGSRLPEGKRNYCNDSCRLTGERLWARELARRKGALTDPIAKIIQDANEYNRKNNKNYSYGQYVAYIMPYLKKDGQK